MKSMFPIVKLNNIILDVLDIVYINFDIRLICICTELYEDKNKRSRQLDYYGNRDEMKMLAEIVEDNEHFICYRHIAINMHRIIGVVCVNTLNGKTLTFSEKGDGILIYHKKQHPFKVDINVLDLAIRYMCDRYKRYGGLIFINKKNLFTVRNFIYHTTRRVHIFKFGRVRIKYSFTDEQLRLLAEFATYNKQYINDSKGLGCITLHNYNKRYYKPTQPTQPTCITNTNQLINQPAWSTWSTWSTRSAWYTLLIILTIFTYKVIKELN